ncbi:MAG: hypothetical protein R2796_05085 [Chitinophagaceae bacterium]|nr:hypothetical protein [Chitinophagaceae bacterium]
MKSLSETWFAEGRIDFELKKYILLAYLQEVNKYFNANKLYPQLADLIFHYNNIVAFRTNKQYLQEHFPKKLTGIQMEKIQTLYELIIEDDDIMQELEDIIQYAADTMKSTIQNGTGLFEFVEDKMSITPIGIMPLDTQEGYFFLSTADSSTTKIYQYRLSIFEKHDEKYRSIKTSFIDNRNRNLANTYEHIKSELIQHIKEMPNPAVYSIETTLNFPINETLLPIAKRGLVKFITEAA